MQNKSNTSDMQVKHFVKTISDIVGFKSDPLLAYKVLYTLNEFEKSRG